MGFLEEATDNCGSESGTTLPRVLQISDLSLKRHHPLLNVDLSCYNVTLNGRADCISDIFTNVFREL
ncbi:hypothetical protein ACROYT_G003305 [Oculina patagonica]